MAKINFNFAGKDARAASCKVDRFIEFRVEQVGDIELCELKIGDRVVAQALRIGSSRQKWTIKDEYVAHLQRKRGELIEALDAEIPETLGNSKG